jgi:hypothetical protein
VMELVSALSTTGHQARVLEHVEVLRDRLAGRAHVVLHRKTRADLEKSLAVSDAEFIEDRPPRGFCQCLEDVTQTVKMIGKQSLACQVSIPPGAVGLASPACRWHGSSLRTIRLLEWSFASCATSWIRRASGFSRSGAGTAG